MAVATYFSGVSVARSLPSQSSLLCQRIDRSDGTGLPSGTCPDVDRPVPQVLRRQDLGKHDTVRCLWHLLAAPDWGRPGRYH